MTFSDKLLCNDSLLLDGSGYAHVYITHAISDRLMLSLPVYKYLSVFNMKQAAVVFEAKIRSAGSAIDLNNTRCADNIQGEKTREIRRGRRDVRLKRENTGARDEGTV